jgi:hypothetical protein
MRIRIQAQAKSEQILFMFSSKKVTFYKRYCLKYAFYTRLPLSDELSVFWLRFNPPFRLILHLLDPDPEPQSNADPMQIRIRIRNTGRNHSEGKKGMA